MTDIEDPIYPDSTAFLTLTISKFHVSHSLPGHYDLGMARFLSKVGADALGRVEPCERGVIAEPISLFTQAKISMRRLGTNIS